MFDLADLLARRHDLMIDAAYDADDAEAVYARYEAGEVDFGDRCHADDRAHDSAADLLALDLGLCALILATEA